MPTPDILSFQSLIEPIPGDNPAGGSVPFQTREQFEEARKEINPDSFAADDPHRPTEAKYADWRGIIRLAEETLANTSKDLQTTARLTEALTREHGFAGLRDGLHLFRLLIDQCWDRLNPTIEDGDMEVRAGPFNWLDDPDRGARFPTAVRRVPLVFGEDRGFGYLDWRQFESAQDPSIREAFEKAVMATSREQCQLQMEDLTQALAELDGLSESLQAKMDSVAPGMLGLRTAVEECRTLADQILRRKGPAPDAAAGPTAAPGAPAAAGAKPAAQAVTSREDAYRQLADAAALLERIEPHSPIPYLVRRAVELGALPFPQLMKQLIRDENVLAMMNRELGIKDSSVSESPAEGS
jgi:type VI secretion system protein ImpA